MTAFAVTQDLVDRWRTLTAEEVTRAGFLLTDASAIVRAECPGVDALITAGTLDALVAKGVVCGMVKRAMISGDLSGITQSQQVAGPFTQGLTYSNPTGDLYLTRADRRRLGFAGQKAFSIDLAPSAVVPAVGDWW